MFTYSSLQHSELLKKRRHLKSRTTPPAGDRGSPAANYGATVASQFLKYVSNALRSVESLLQAWVTSFETGEKNGLADLHPDVWRATPRLDILHENLRWQERYRCMVREDNGDKMLPLHAFAGLHKSADAIRNTRQQPQAVAAEEKWSSASRYAQIAAFHHWYARKVTPHS